MDYTDYKLLTIVNPASTASKVELLRVANHLRNIVGYTNIYLYWFEGYNMPEYHRHVHIIIKKKNVNDIPKMSAAFKKQKLRWMEYSYNEDDEPIELTHEIDTSKFTFNIKSFTSQNHFDYTRTDYRWKECDEFNEKKDIFLSNKPIFILSSCSIPFMG